MRPDYLQSGDSARLFPVLSNSSKEGRATAILLATLRYVEPFRKEMLSTVGAPGYQKATIDAYTEVTFSKALGLEHSRPDGLFIVQRGKSSWRCLVEAKIGNAALKPQQVEDYRKIAQANDIDCVVTISNQLTSDPSAHPLDEIRNSRNKKIPAFHWSWTFILTKAELLLKAHKWDSKAQKNLLHEFLRFLRHESTGVKGFDRMPPAWQELNKMIHAGGKLKKNATEVAETVEAWHQETRELSLIMSQKTESVVDLKLKRGHLLDVKARRAEDIARLCEDGILQVSLDVHDAAAPMVIEADTSLRSIRISMELDAPQDKATAKGRLNWVLRQIKTDHTEHLNIKLVWRNKRLPTQASFDDLKLDLPDNFLLDAELKTISVIWSEPLSAKFSQRAKFISELERIVPLFYREVGQNLVSWRPPAPKITEEKSESQDVSEVEGDSEIEF